MGYYCKVNELNMDLFRKKPTIKEQVREGERAIRKETRNVERDRRGLEREEKKLEMEIKKAAKAGNKQACTVLAKQLVQLRKQKTRTYTATSQMQAVNYGMKGMAANVKLEETMNDALDDILADSDDESEEQAVIDKVLDEIGIEISGKLADAPSAHAGTIGDKSKAKATDEDKEIEAMLAQLKA